MLHAPAHNPFKAPNHTTPNLGATVRPGESFDDFARDCFDWAPLLPHDQGAYTVLSLSGCGERYVLTPGRGPAKTCLCTCPSHARLRTKARAANAIPAECKHAALAPLAPAFLARLRDLWHKGHAPDSARALWEKRLAMYDGDHTTKTLAALRAVHAAQR